MKRGGASVPSVKLNVLIAARAEFAEEMGSQW
jgi:hypothetical protein